MKREIVRPAFDRPFEVLSQYTFLHWFPFLLSWVSYHYHHGSQEIGNKPCERLDNHSLVALEMATPINLPLDQCVSHGYSFVESGIAKLFCAIRNHCFSSTINIEEASLRWHLEAEQYVVNCDEEYIVENASSSQHILEIPLDRVYMVSWTIWPDLHS